MEMTDVILQRRSIRNYTDQPISDDDLDAIITAGTSAPSGLNLQPWFFVVLKSDQAKQEMFDIMERVAAGIGPELESRFSGKTELIHETTRFIRTLGNAPVIVLAFLMRDDYADKKTALLSVAAAVENILLAAREKGIGSCWLTAPEQTGHESEIRERFASGKGELAAVITLGYTDKWPKAVARRDGRVVIL